MRFVWTVLVTLLLVGCDTQAPLKNGDLAPPFTLQNLENEPLYFPSDLKGQSVVLRFWADWCPYCRTEMQQIDTMRQDLTQKGLSILAINVGQDQQTAATFLQDIGVGLGSLLDTEGEVATQYRVLGLPTTFFIGRDGRIRSKIVGEANKTTFLRMTNAVLAKPDQALTRADP
ncbi:TlpA family protein disulfide reductase [Magnetococcus sp. PR-3]|uniref:TlpA family protein disulfide reductase n=1 Tax=Magnetococcus sp. PR-3 TaxID=3120355 RepID=UPI002FCE268E